jgi:DNA-binding LacI/PurR family transcriptional regulator
MSITKVAKIAGVSHGTVSRVINARPGISPDTIRAVRLAMAEIGYVPPPPEKRRGRTAAPNLFNGLPAPNGEEVAGRTRMIGLLVFEESLSILNEPVIAAAMAGIEAALAEYGLGLQLAQVSQPDRLPATIDPEHVDGVLFTANRVPKALRSQLIDFHAVRFLSSIADPDEEVWIDHILPDNQQIGVMAARYLGRHQHQHVAFIDATPRRLNFHERGNAFCMVAQNAGLHVSRIAVNRQERDELYPSIANVRAWLTEAVDQLLKINPRPTGIFVPSDRHTSLVYPLLAERGIKIGPASAGGEIEIISCDNEESRLESLNPRPASIDIGAVEIGRRAVRRLLIRLQHPEESPVRVLVPPNLPDGAGGNST